jgi:hypothetical protein
MRWGLQTQPCSHSEPGFGCPKALSRIAAQPHSHTATQPHSRRSSVSSDTLPLSRSKLGVGGLFVWHIYQADLELAQKHDNLLSSTAMLGIG